jgi:putative spermidine/putrescine transport system substrate-binding protein
MHRFFVSAALVSAAALALSGCVQSSNASGGGGGSSSSSAGKDLTVFLSADTNIQDLWQKTLIPAFEKANPGYSVKVDFDLHGLHDQQTIAKLTAATVQKRDPGYDMVDAGFVSQIAASGLLAKVTTKNLKPLADVPASVVKAGGDGGIPYRASSVLLAYDSKTVPTPPKTLDDLLAWIKANPGKFTYNSPDSGGSGQSFVTTVLDKTVPKADREKMVTEYDPDLESDWDKGFATLASLNPYVFQQGVYPNGNNQVLDLLSSGQISMAPVWSDQFITGQKNGQIPANIKYTQITDPSLTGGAAYLGIPRASKHQAGALKLAAWLLSPDAQVLVSDGIAGYPVISLDKLPSSVQEKFKDADIAQLRPPYFSSVQSDMNKAWSEKVPGK